MGRAEAARCGVAPRGAAPVRKVTMSIMGESRAARVRRPTWRDPRLGVGVVLIAGSVALGAWALDTADETVAVWSAGEHLMPGDVLALEALHSRQVRWDGGDGVYLLADHSVPEGMVVIRPIARGELVPVSALGTGEEIDLRPIGLEAPLGAVVAAGSRVDVWSAVPTSGPSGVGTVLGEPELLAEDLVVASVSEGEGIFAGGSDRRVQVLVPADRVGDVLAVENAGGVITVVVRPGGSFG